MPLREAREKTKFVRSNDKQNNHGGSDTWGDIMNIGSIHEYDEFLGIETLNPLVAVFDFRRVRVLRHKKKLYGFYGICLKDKIHGGT